MNAPSDAYSASQKPDVPAALAAHSAELGPNVSHASFFLGREVPVPSLRPDVPLWQEKLEDGPELYKTFRAKKDGCIKVVMKP